MGRGLCTDRLWMEVNRKSTQAINRQRRIILKKNRLSILTRRITCVTLSAVMVFSSLGALPASAKAGGTPIEMRTLSNVNRDDALKLAVLFPFINGDDVVGSTLTAKYTLSINGASTSSINSADQSTFQWYVGDTRNGAYKPLDGETNRTLSLTEAHLNKYIRVEVTPKTASATGKALSSDPVGPVLSKEDFSKITLKLTKEGTYLEDREKLTAEIKSRFSNVTYFTVDTVIAAADQMPEQNLVGSSYYYSGGERKDFGKARPTVSEGKVQVNEAFVTNVLSGTYDFKGQATAPLDDVLAANGLKAFYATDEVQKATNGNWRTTAMAEGLVIISGKDADLGIDIIQDRDVLNEMTNQVYDLHASDEELEWFEDATLGMFIHWDPGTRTGREIGWGRGPGPAKIKSKVPIYDLSYLDFDPENFDADAIAEKALSMGCKYLVFTTKHHGGFVSWDTNYYPEHSISSTPYAKDKAAKDYDIVAQLADACHKQGLKFGLYYSPQDWYNDYCWSEEHYRWMETYMGHLTELMAKYGKIDIFWCDAIGSALSMYKNTSPTGYADKAAWSAWDPRTILRRVKQLQPGIIVNDRYAYRWEDPKPWDSGALPEDIRGDFITPEQTTAGFNDEYAWESCLTIDGGNAWSYNQNSGAKSPVTLTQDIVENSVNGGNVLLNIGLMPNGEFSEVHLKAFEEIGAWVVKNKEALDGTRGGPYKEPSWGGSTYKTGEGGKTTIYLHIGAKINKAQAIKDTYLQIPNPGNGKTYAKASLLDGTPVGIVPVSDGGYILTLPSGVRFADGSSMDNLDTIIKLEEASGEALSSIHFAQETVEVAGGKRISLNLVAEPAGAAIPNLTWETSEPKIADVTNGIVYGMQEGQATITAKAGDNLVAKCTVNVVAGGTSSYGFNLLNGSKLTATNTASSNGTENLIDNNPETYWKSNQNYASTTSTNSIQAALGARRNFNRIVLSEPYGNTDCPGYRFFISDDGSHWVQLRSGSAIGEELVLDFPEGTAARYVKLELDVKAYSAAYLAEFGVYDSKDASYKPSSDAQMLAFRVGNTAGHIDVNRRITLEVPADTDITSLTPIIEVSPGATVSPSGPQNFQNGTVQYTVTAEDGKATLVYDVAMTVGTGYVNGPNLARGLGDDAYTAISHYEDETKTNTKPQWAFDGVTSVPDGTYEIWAPANANNANSWLQVDFGKGVTFNAVMIYDRNNNGRIVSVDVQTPGSSGGFETVKSFSVKESDTPKVLQLDQAVTASSLRLANITTTNKNGPHVVEVEVYNRVESNDFKMTGIEISTMPTKTTYQLGEAFDPSGMVVTAKYSDGSSAPVLGYEYQPVLGLTAKTTEIVVNYNGKTASVPVTVEGSEPPAATLERIEITKQPTKTAYTAGERFSADGMEVTAHYSDQSSTVVSDYTFSPTGALTVETKEIVVSYGGKQVSVPITVTSSGSSGGTSVTPSTTYQIKVEQTAGGSVSPATTRVQKGSSCSFTITPDKGYVIRDVLVDGVSVGAVSTYRFEKVNASHTIKAVFAADSAATMLYADVPAGSWYYDAVKYVTDNHLMNGTSDKQFTPNGTLTRAMLATILYRMDHSPSVTAKSPFQDVSSGMWYSDAVIWANEHGIVNGVSDGRFDPNANVTREQMASMLMRYAAYKKYDVAAAGSLSGFTDADAISAYATSSVQWAIGNGLIQGRTASTIAPKGTATRAESAALLMRFQEKVVSPS